MLKMIELPYTLDALEPYYSKETLALHYNELYKGYVENTNKTNERIKNMRTTNNFEDIKCLEKNLSFLGSGVILHELFFLNLGISIPTSPNRNLMEQLIKDFRKL